MVISIYKPPEDGKTWAEQKCGDICDVISYEYEKYFNGVGTFTLELPVNTRFRAELLVNRVLVTDSGDALIIRYIQTTLERIKVTGYDLNGLLCDRVTLGTDEGGYDPCEGSTEYCVKYYVSNNLVSSAVPQRNLPRFDIVGNALDRGIAADHAYPRYQNLQELVTEMCAPAKLGWRVSIDTKSTGDKPVFLFDVYEQTDRSVNQSERDRVIFSAQTHNVSGMTREVGVTSAKNTLYLDIDGTVVQYPREPETDSADTTERVPGAGYDRREEYCSLSGKSLDEEVYKVEAEQNMADRMQETDSLTIDAGSPLDYGTRYDVGTVVTVFDRERSLQLDSVISAVTVKRTAEEYSVKLTLGESKPKLLDQYAKKSEVVGRTMRNEVPKISAGGLIPLTEYEYLTDLSAKCNGVTYTVEKDADTGLIAKISDSNENEFKPTINSGITDVALHNAVFWAVAMARGFGGKKVYGNTNIFEMSNVADGIWKNAGDGYDIVLPDGAEVTDEGVSLKTESYYLPITGTVGDYTMFVVAKKRADFTSTEWTSVIGNYGTLPQFNLCTRNLNWSIGTGEASGRYLGSISAEDYAVLTMRKSGTNGVFFINQVQKSSYNGYITPISDFWHIESCFWFKYIAIFPNAMSDAEITAKIAELMTTYGI